MNIFIDIETVKSSRIDLSAYFKAKQKPPAKMSVQTTIDKWWKDKAEGDLEKQIEKTSLSGDYGEIISISWVLGNGSVSNVYRYPENSEAYLLQAFNLALVADLEKREISNWVGFNHISFDLPFLRKRFILNSIKPNFNLPVNSKAWDKNVCDLMIEWAGHGGRISQDELCFILGIEGKPSDICGANVGQHYIDGNHEKIIEYNNDDVGKLRQIYNRVFG